MIEKYFYINLNLSQIRLYNMSKITDIFLNLSNGFIIDILTNLFDIMDKTSNLNTNPNPKPNPLINKNFVSNVSINLCLMNYNQIYNCLISKMENNIIKQIITIQQIYNYDILFILELSFEISIGIIKQINIIEFIWDSKEHFINSIKKQIESIINTNYIIFTNLIQNYKFKKMFPIKPHEYKY